MKLLGSHNSMSYLPPRRWWMRPFAFMARCQSRPLYEQLYIYDIRYFDLRVRFINGNPTFAHGLISYNGDVFDALNTLNSYHTPIYVRLLLETAKADQQQEDLFCDFCADILSRYPNLRLHCGRRKFDWHVLFCFPDREPTLDQKVASMTGTILDDWFPWLYARLNNRSNLLHGTDHDILLLDFINIK